MTSIPQPEQCGRCQAQVVPEWVPPINCAGKVLAGTGTWRSQLLDGKCSVCSSATQEKVVEQIAQMETHIRLIALGGGEKPYRQFRFESFTVTPANQLAFTSARSFNPERDSLYFWGACGVGKTHLAFAAARRMLEAGRNVEFQKAPQLMRKVRMKEPEEEQRAIDRFVRSETFVLDDLGIGTDTAYARQIFQEILDGRDYADRFGLIVTSKYSLDGLAAKLDDDTISSRLAGMCRVIEVGGADHRLTLSTQSPAPPDGPVL